MKVASSGMRFPVETTPDTNRLAEVDGIRLMDQGVDRCLDVEDAGVRGDANMHTVDVERAISGDMGDVTG